MATAREDGVIATLEHMGVTTRDEAARLIDMYARRDELTDDELTRVVDHFPAEMGPGE